MDRKGVVNIINFIRGVDPRDPNIDLVGTVANQIELVNKHHFPATWLLQYDALIMPEYVEMLKELGPEHEIGVWFETPKPMLDLAGLPWRGRPGWEWDWHTDVDFSVGYTPIQREKLADIVMEEFKAVFGKYPASVGSWFMDAHLLGYLADHYGVCSSCNCRDQIGTDGYTLWGGYWGQAFYPSRKNAYMPAQTLEQQIPIPIFRMLGSDPIYQYSSDLGGNGQGVVTLEPVYTGNGGGGDPEWVRWFFDVSFTTPCITFGYAQAGQENSFGWPLMGKGLTYQVELLREWVDQGKLTVETLESSSAWFRATYPMTPASAVTALSDWKNEGRKSAWYNSRYYRTNLFWQKEGFSVRDIHLFDEQYTERYLEAVCTTHDAAYDTLPICDGFVWSGRDKEAGIRLWMLRPDGSRYQLGSTEPVVEEKRENLQIHWQEADGTAVQILCSPDALEFCVKPGIANSSWYAEMSWAENAPVPLVQITSGELQYRYNDHDYKLPICKGSFAVGTDGASIVIAPENHEITLGFSG